MSISFDIGRCLIKEAMTKQGEPNAAGEQPRVSKETSWKQLCKVYPLSLSGFSGTE